jgi:hypothetical protein
MQQHCKPMDYSNSFQDIKIIVSLHTVPESSLQYQILVHLL